MGDNSDNHGFPLVLHKDADPSSTGGVAICGFSNVGMVGSIATSHIIKALGLQQLGTVIDRDFPPVALIQNEVPQHPVRVYQGDRIGIFTSDLQFPGHTDVKFAETVLDWFKEGGFDRLFVIDGIVTGELGDKEIIVLLTSTTLLVLYHGVKRWYIWYVSILFFLVKNKMKRKLSIGRL